MIRILLIFGFFLCAAQVSFAQEPPPYEQIHEDLKLCLQEKNFDRCTQAIYQLGEKKQTDDIREIESFVFENCIDSSDDACYEYAGILEEQFRYREALEIHNELYRRNYKYDRRGLILQRLGALELASRAYLDDCKRDNGCNYALRYMPYAKEHPEFVSRSLMGCFLESRSTGATSCTIVGVYINHSGRKQFAKEILKKDCQSPNVNGCLLYLSQTKNSAELSEIVGDLCKPNSVFRMEPTQGQVDEVCNSYYSTGYFNANLLKEADDLYRGYILEQSRHLASE